MDMIASRHRALAKVSAIAASATFFAISVSLAHLVSGASLARAANAEAARMHAPWPEDLLRACTSADPAASAYCDGYLESAANFWKVATACQSGAPADRAYCAGATAASKKMREVSEACNGCDRSRPEYLAKLRTAVGTCAPDATRDSSYCAGYNGVVDRELSAVMDLWKSSVPATPALMGRMDAQSDLGMALFASEAMASFKPCVSLTTGLKQVRDIVVDFIRKHPGAPPDPEGSGRLSSYETVARALCIGLCPGPALLAPPTGRVTPHLEFCTHMSFYGGDYHTENACNVDVVFAFQSRYRAVERTLKPGEAFHAGLKPGQEKGFLFTTCPVGFTSSIPIAGNGSSYSELRYGRYECVRR